ncbi:dihydrolipoyl dehydrogenase [Candidatus Marinimicrobia bacterium]|nr:dihydrolipoyl dehydrogenase [Candidatus Neomarinimicrobiota bacterium]MDC0593984.1 dihydrolipoyl dehydrogenase [Candidatus Neomarinimicrobiota bacterium]MDC1145578.1 dihydrolipoyl dehydrogenase [Candidatus Neomarinimicrobiota bacterium]MDC3287944.1 dihydrolipoyl dehydrogenase [Candidatus Neomarinimicrobiota bacterium]
MKKYQLIVVGGGPGGYTAAFRAAELGMSVAIVDDNDLGGVCLNWGCIPTKSLLKNAEAMDLINASDSYGISVKDITVDFKFIINKSVKARQRLSRGLHHQVKKHNIDFHAGFGTFIDKNTIVVNETSITADTFIIATGSKPKTLPNLNADHSKVVYAKDIFQMSSIPKSMTIIGAGAIGVEFAYFFNSFGTNITLIEAEENILPHEDKEVSQWVEKVFKKKKINILTGTLADKIDDEKILISVGVEGNSQGMGLEEIGINFSANNHIAVDRNGKTNIDNIYAVGDVIGAPWLAHVSAAEGLYAVEHLCGLNPKKIDYNSVPACTYSKPEVASIGSTEQQLIDSAIDFKVAKSFFIANGKAVAVGATDGFIKMLVGKEGNILGAHIVGSNATEMISELSVIKSNNLTVNSVFDSVHPHPTFSEAIFETLLQLK